MRGGLPALVDRWLIDRRRYAPAPTVSARPVWPAMPARPVLPAAVLPTVELRGCCLVFEASLRSLKDAFPPFRPPRASIFQTFARC